MKKGLNLEEAFKALNGRLSVKENVNDFPKLTDLAKGKVFTAYFGNHESCDFSYDSTKDILIQKYYDPADTFKYKNIKTQTDFEKAVKDDLGDGKITWEKKDSRKPAHLKNEAIKSKKLKETLTKASAEWLRALDKIKTNKITRVDLDDQDILIFKVERDKVLVMLADDPDDVETFPLTTFVEDFIDYYLISSDGFETFEKIAAIDEKEYRRLIGKEVSQKWLRALDKIKRNAFSKVELDDQDTLLFKVEGDKVFVQLFDSQTEEEFPLTTFVEDFIDTYLIGSDGFETFERIKIISKEEYEELADPNPGHYDDHGKWAAPKSN